MNKFLKYTAIFTFLSLTIGVVSAKYFVKDINQEFKGLHTVNSYKVDEGMTLAKNADVLELDIYSADVDLRPSLEGDFRYKGSMEFNGEELFEIGFNETTKSLFVKENQINNDTRSKFVFFNINQGKKISLEIPKQVKRLMVKNKAGDFDIELPSLEALVYNGVSGDLKARVNLNEFHFENISGDLDWRGQADNLRIKSTSGDLELALFKSTKSISAETVSGDIHLYCSMESCPADYSFESVSGDLVMEKIYQDKMIDLVGSKYFFKTVSGDFLVKEPKGELSFKASIESSNGE